MSDYAYAALLAICAALLLSQPQSLSLEAEVLKVEDTFRAAKLQNDVGALREIVAGEARITGALRDIQAGQPEPRRGGGAVRRGCAIVTGSQREVNKAGKEQLLFTRVYIKRAGRWRLLSGTQLIPDRLLMCPAPRGFTRSSL